MSTLIPVTPMPIGTSALGAPAAIQPPFPNPSDLKAFNEAMADPASGLMNTGGSPKNISTTGAFDGAAGLNFDPTSRGKNSFAVHADKAPALGDAILQGIQKASGNYQSQLSDLRMNLQALSSTPGPIAPQNLLNMQVNLMQLDMQINIASKIANKLSQGVQTLFKNQ